MLKHYILGSQGCAAPTKWSDLLFTTGSFAPGRVGLLRANAWILALIIANAAPVAAQTPVPAEPQVRQQEPLAPTDEGPDKGSIWQRDHLMGDIFGVRSALEKRGITITL